MSDKNSKQKSTQLIRGVLRTTAGMASTKPSDFLKLAAHNGDLLLKREFSQAIYDTYTYFVNKAKIDKKYFDTKDFADLAPEFRRIERGDFSIIQLDTLRKMFVNLALNKSKNKHQKYLIDIALTLTEPEIIVLTADWDMGQNNVLLGRSSHADWAAECARVSKLQHVALIESAEDGLIKKKLLTSRDYSDGSRVHISENTSRLTTMAQELCEMTLLDDDPLEQT